MLVLGKLVANLQQTESTETHPRIAEDQWLKATPGCENLSCLWSFA